MKQLANDLRRFVRDINIAGEVKLSADEERLFRSLKTAGERATKGRLISRCIFEAKMKRGELSLMMLMEGRHSMSVGRQVVRGFEDKSDVMSVDVFRTRHGACVLLRPVTGESGV